jgi:SPP1 gp7 family putative phage head morphogenesis protein
MRDLILKTLRESVKAYPELKGYLSDEARLCADIMAIKIGEAPDDNMRLKDEKELAGLLEEFLGEQRRRIIRELKKDFGSKSIFNLDFWKFEDKKLWSKVSGKILDILTHGVNGALNLIPESIRQALSIDNLQRSLMDYAMRYRKDWIEGINSTTQKNVYEMVDSWRNTGEPIEVLTDALQKLGFDETRAKMIATTETTRLNALAHEISYKESGVIRQFRWMTAQDERVCAVCGANHGNLFPVDQLHDLIPAHPNCRCWDEPVFDEREAEGPFTRL